MTNQTGVITNQGATKGINPAKGRLIAYWIVTGLLTPCMFFGGLFQVLHNPWTEQGFRDLGYPMYFMTIIGSWKMLGVIALLVPRFPLLKEWAYAGFFFAMTGAWISHLVHGDPVTKWIAPFMFAILTVLSWYLRPASRRIDVQ